MPAIELRLLDEPVLAELSDAPERYAAREALVLIPHADLVQAVAQQTRSFVQQHGITAPWGGYLAVDPATSAKPVSAHRLTRACSRRAGGARRAARAAPSAGAA